jgi:hypothetical protein
VRPDRIRGSTCRNSARNFSARPMRADPGAGQEVLHANGELTWPQGCGPWWGMRHISSDRLGYAFQLWSGERDVVGSGHDKRLVEAGGDEFQLRVEGNGRTVPGTVWASCCAVSASQNPAYLAL